MKSGLSFLILITLVLGSDIQRQLEYEQTLSVLLDLVQENRLQDFDSSSIKKCVSATCCLCGKQFKNATYSALHLTFHHADAPTHLQVLQIMFDEEVPSHDRHHYCLNYLKNMNISSSHREAVCLVISEDLHKEKVWLTIIKYVLYVVFGLMAIVYYSDMGKEKER